MNGKNHYNMLENTNRDLEEALKRSRKDGEVFRGELSELQLNMGKFEKLKADNTELLQKLNAQAEVSQKAASLER